MGNIINISNNYDRNLYVTEAAKTRKAETIENKAAEQRSDVQKQDVVSLSKASKDIQVAKDAVAAAPDIRHEKVDPIKQKIAEGRYQLNTDTVAERMIGVHISEWA